MVEVEMVAEVVLMLVVTFLVVTLLVLEVVLVVVEVLLALMVADVDGGSDVWYTRLNKYQVKILKVGIGTT